MKSLLAGVLVVVMAGPAAAFQEGIYVASWRAGQYTTGVGKGALDGVPETGASWIAVVRPRFQRTIFETSMQRELDALGQTHRSPTDADIEAVVSWAHGKGLKVMLVPHVKVLASGEWKGMIGDGFGEADWSAWFGSYQAVIAEEAALAKRLGVDQLCLGNELRNTSHREGEWREVIATARAGFSGPLTYAAHHDEVYRIAWWDALDAIGVDAYWDLVQTNDATVEDLEGAWRPHARRLRDLSRRFDKTVIFTEVGFRSVDGAATKPWDFSEGATVDAQEQADAYESVFRAFFDAPWVGGIYWWAWDLDGHGGATDTGYTPQGKPAEDVLRRWFAGERPEAHDWVYRDETGAGWRASAWSGSLDLEAAGGRLGSLAVRAEIEALGGVSFEHPGLAAAGRNAIEFFLRGDAKALMLTVEANGQECTAELGEYVVGRERGWLQLRVPVSHLAGAEGRVRIHVQDVSGTDTTLWLDAVRLVEHAPVEDPVGHLAGLFDLSGFFDALARLLGSGRSASVDSGDQGTGPRASAGEIGDASGILGALGRQR